MNRKIKSERKRIKNNGNKNNNLWTRIRLFAAAGLVALPLGIIGVARLLDDKKHDAPIQFKALENIVDSSEKARQLTINGFYTNNILVREQVRQDTIIPFLDQQLNDNNFPLKHNARDIVKYFIFKYYDFVLDSQRNQDETYAFFNQQMQNVVDKLEELDPVFAASLKDTANRSIGESGKSNADINTINKLLGSYFRSHGYTFYITPDIVYEFARPNVILMETSDVKTFEVNHLGKIHLMSYRDIIGVAVPWIQGYEEQGNETEGLVIAEKDKEPTCLIDTIRSKRIAETAWNHVKNENTIFAQLLRKIFQINNKNNFIQSYTSMAYQATLVHEATHDFRRAQGNQKSNQEEELIAFLNEIIEGPNALFSMNNLLRNGEAPQYKLALSNFRANVLQGISPSDITDQELRNRSRKYLTELSQ